MLKNYVLSWSWEPGDRIPASVEMSWGSNFSRAETDRIMKSWRDGMRAAGFHDVKLTFRRDEVEEVD